MNLIDIEKMTTKEKVQAMELLWDSLIDNEVDIETPEWHQSVLNQRMKKIEEGRAEFFTLEEVKSLNK